MKVVIVPVISVSPPPKAVNPEVITSICAPPIPRLAGSILTVEAIDIAALASPGLLIVKLVGTAVPPVGATGKNAVFFTFTDFIYCVSASNVPHQIIGTSTYSHAKSPGFETLGGVGPVASLLVTVISA